MFKRHAKSNRKLISKSTYAIAFAFPFISLFGETKASKIVSSENQLFVQNKQSKSLQFTPQLNHNKFNLNFDNFLISEGVLLFGISMSGWTPGAQIAKFPRRASRAGFALVPLAFPCILRKTPQIFPARFARRICVDLLCIPLYFV